MGRAVAVRGDYTSTELRVLAARCRNAGHARGLLRIVAAGDGASRAEAAKIGGMDQ